jgi:glutamine amidotransferase
VIAIVDYGIGNLGSATRGLAHTGAEVRLSGDPAVLARADALVLPGDGAFGAAMAELDARGLTTVLREAVDRGTPLVGICVGMQLLFEESEEHGLYRGLGLLPGRVRRFEGPLPVPHMGWTTLAARQAHPVLDGVPDGSHVYFVHSYCCDAAAGDVVAVSDYGREFPAIVARGPVLGLQFHPEKSQGVGLRLLANVVAWIASRDSRSPEPAPLTERSL